MLSDSMFLCPGPVPSLLGWDCPVHYHATRHSHKIFKNGPYSLIVLIVVEDQNALSTTNRKPPKNLFDKFSNTATNN